MIKKVVSSSRGGLFTHVVVFGAILCMAFSIQVNSVSSEISMAGSAVCGGLLQEAELGVINGSLFQIGLDSNASAGQFVFVPDGSGSSYNGAFSSPDFVEYCFDVTEAGNYEVYGSISFEGTQALSDSFYITINDQPSIGYKWFFDSNVTDTGFIVDKLNDTGRTDPVLTFLGVGQHTVKVFLREDGAKLDEIGLLKQGDPIPTPTVPVASPTPLPSLTPVLSPTPVATIDPNDCGDLIQEAELGTISGNLFQVGSVSNASAGQFVFVPEGSGSFYGGVGSSSNFVEYCFEITEAGNYELFGGISFEGTKALSDSFYVQVNDQPAIGYKWFFDSNVADTAFIDDKLNDTGTTDPVIIPLAVGQQSIKVFLREDGAKLDTIGLIRQGDPIPTATPEPVASPTPEITVTPTPEPQACGGLVQEAEIGTISGSLFQVGNDVVASGGQFVFVPEGSGSFYGGVGSSTNFVEYCFDITEAGEYELFGDISFEGSQFLSDSFYVQINDQPSIGYKWFFDSNVTDTAFLTDKLNDTGTTDPVTFLLGVGEQSVKVFLREDGAKLDRIGLTKLGGSSSDTTPPVITVLGDDPLLIDVGSTFVDPGATASDDTDGDITGNIMVGGATVDTNLIGDYIITYNVSDVAGNAAVQETRTVTVQSAESIVPAPAPSNATFFTAESTLSGLSGAEIPAFDPGSDFAFVTSESGLQVIDLSNPTNPINSMMIDPVGSPFDQSSSVVTSVDSCNGLIAFAVPDDTQTVDGSVIFIDANGNLQQIVTVGALPDSVAFTPDCSKLLVANEGEPDGGIDPDGSVSIIDTTTFVAQTADFTGFDGQEATLRTQGVRIFPGIDASNDFEPEYIAISADSSTAFVTLQENNALAVVNIATAMVTSIEPLGTKDHSLAGNELDTSDSEGQILMRNMPVNGMFMPDAIDSFVSGGNTYYVTANEGDARSEDSRIKDLILDPTVFPNAALLQADENIGRLQASTIDGDTDGDSDFDFLNVYGGRSFTIFDASGNVVFESGSQVESIVATYATWQDGRSDNKGPEPEGVETGVINGTPYIFVGLERTSNVLVYDVSTPTAPVFVQILETAGDISPEGIEFVSATDSPNGCPLLLVTNEVSNTFTVYQLTNCTPIAPAPTLLISEIMYNPDSSEDNWEWVELYNFGSSAVDLTGFVIDDNNGTAHTAANIASGSIPAGGSAVLYNADDLTAAEFLEAWGTVDLIPVTNWGAMGLNNGGDTLGIWSSFADYDGDNETQANVFEQVVFTDDPPWPADNNSASIYLTDLSADNNDGANWALSTDGGTTPLFDGYTSLATSTGNDGGDVGSPGTPAPLVATVPELLLSEIVVTPTDGEFIEIYNPGSSAVDLSDVYLTDATFANGSAFYYNLVTGSNAGGGGFTDFLARFPDGASIDPGEYQTVAIAGSDNFFTAYGVNPTYELFEDGGSADGIADMREALSGSIDVDPSGGLSGLSNGGEVVILFYWDGESDLVTDLDYAVWGDKAEAVDKTSVAVDGPDADSDTSTYLNDTAIASQDVIAAGGHASGSSWQRDDLTEGAEVKSGGNGASGHDETSEDLSNTWCESATLTPNAASQCPAPPTANLQITEIWPGQEGTDLTEDWFEIYNFSSTPWVSGTDADLYYDDESAGQAEAFIINGIVDIQPGESVVVVIGDAAQATAFSSVWADDYNLSGIEVGYTDGSGLGQGGDAVTIFLGDPTDPTTPGTQIDQDIYPNAESNSGQSWDVINSAFSTDGGGAAAPGTNVAAATTELGGTNGDEPAIASPGNQGLLTPVTGLSCPVVESFEAAPSLATYSLSNTFDDSSFDFFDRYAVPDNGNGARNDYQLGWDGGFGIIGQDHDGDGNAATQTITLADIDVSGVSLIQVVGAFGAQNNASFDNFSIADGDSIRVYATLDGGSRVLIGAFEPPSTGLDGTPNAGNLSLDTNLDGFGDGAELDFVLTDYSFTVPGTGNILKLEIDLTSTDSFETVAVDNIRVNCDPSADLQVTEIWAGQSGTDLTADWFEIYNAGVLPWVSGTDPALYYDDSDAVPAEAVAISGITDIQPGESVIVIVDSTDTATFNTVWGPDYDLTGIEVGSTGSADALGGNGDAVNLWIGDPTAGGVLADSEAYPDTSSNDGESWDVVNGAFSTDGGGAAAPGTNVAAATTALGGNSSDTPAVGSPGNQGPIVAATLTKIHAVQGSGANVAISTEVIVEGIVIGTYQGTNELDGFFLQEEDADADADPNTSEGIFIYCGVGNANCSVVAEGDLVEVTGTPGDFFDMSQITASAITVKSNNNPLPTVTTVSLPASGDTAATDTFESVEGMLVQFDTVLTVTEFFQLYRYGQVVLSEGGRLRQFTNDVAPTTAAAYDAYQAQIATRRIILDDRNDEQNQLIDIYHPQPNGLSTTNFFRGGETVTNLTGVMHYSWSGESGTDAWRIRPTDTNPVSFNGDNPRPVQSDINVGSADVTIATLNVLNYFTTVDLTSSRSSGDCGPSATLDCRGADSNAELQRQQDKLAKALAAIDADIVGLVEIENNASASLQSVVDIVNAEVGAGTYDFINTGTIGTDAIKVGFIYKPAVITPVGNFEILDSTDDARFIDTKNRPALAQTFRVTESGNGSENGVFTAVVNHLKSKGSDCTDTGIPNDDDTTTGQGNCNGTRTAAAEAMVDWLATDPTGSGDPDFMIIGDINAYAKEDPIMAILEGADDTANTADDFNDLILDLNGTGAYSFVFDGQWGYLDHVLANDALKAQVTGVYEWHINSEEINVLDYNDDIRDTGESDFEQEPGTNTGATNSLYNADFYRVSDHDPVIVGLDLTPSDPADNGTLNVTVNVVNDNGGSAVAGDFTVQVTGNNPTPNSFAGTTTATTVSIEVGAYNASLAPFSGYTFSGSVDCSGNMAADETKSCTLTADDDATPPTDTTPPVITFSGSNPLEVELNATFDDAAALADVTANDDTDGEISVNVGVDSESVDTSTVGDYDITYTVSDAAGNAAVPVNRTIRVVDSSAAGPDLILTGIMDGPLSGGTPKMIEICVVNDVADLSIYSVGIGSNGNPVGTPVALSGSATAGDFIYVTNPSHTSEFQTWFGFAAGFSMSVINGNGDDAMVILQDGTVIDAYGVVGTDGSGETWEYTDGWGYRVNGTGPEATFVSANWTFSGRDALDGESTNAGATTPFPTASYTCGAASSDTTPPVITFSGADPLEVELNSTFNNAVALADVTATDNIDGDISDNVVFGTEIVDTSIVGDYPIIYNVSDEAGNAAVPVNRTIRVVDSSAAGPDLILTGIMDGPLSGGTPKMIEICVVNDVADLSIYSVGIGSNGNPVGTPVALSGSATAGDFIYVTNPSHTSEFQTWFGFAADFSMSVINGNGDDAMVILQDGTVIDAYGVVGTDGSGETWEYTDGWGYRVNGTGPEATFVSANWTFSGRDALDGESTNAGATTPFPTASYTCGAATADDTPPDITFTGGDPIFVAVGENTGVRDVLLFDVTATDDVDGDITENIQIGGDTVDFSVIGDYNITYDVDDAAGNSADQVSRVVTVFEPIDLVITGVLDGGLSGGLPKVIEACALFDIPDLSVYGFGSANNGGGSAGQEFTPSGSLSAGDFIYITTNTNAFGFYFDMDPANIFVDNVANINGDDAIELFKNGSVVDVFGDINTDGSGQPWDYLDGWAYREDFTGPDGSTFTLDNWSFSGINNSDGVLKNEDAPLPFPIGTYQPCLGPSVILDGDDRITLNLNDAYSEPGFSAQDSFGEDVTANVVVGGDTVNTSAVGTYVVTYDVTDDFGQAGQQTTRTVTVTDSSLETSTSFEDQVLVLVNLERAAADPACPPVTFNADLREAAYLHSKDMADNDYFAHEGRLNNSQPSERAESVGYTNWTTIGENIAAGQTTPQDVMTSWMNSTGHRANILNCSYTELGVGYFTGGPFGHYWTQVFGSRN